MEQRRLEREKLRDAISSLLPSVPRFRDLFGDTDAKSIDISGALQRVAVEERALEKELAITGGLHARLLDLAPFVERFRRIFGDTDPAILEPAQDRADLQSAITLAETTAKSLETQVSRLNLFRFTYPGKPIRPRSTLCQGNQGQPDE
ncbi:TPA: hypothetical protein ACL1SW_006540 [Pseudomonas aeruginosa]